MQVSWVTQDINLTSAGAAIMSRMPIANQAAFQVGLMVRAAAALLPHFVGGTDVYLVGGVRSMLSGAAAVTSCN